MTGIVVEGKDSAGRTFEAVGESVSRMAIPISGVAGVCWQSLVRYEFNGVEAFGGTSRYIMFRTVLPNAWSPILVQCVVLSSVAILLEAALSFLGVGIPPPTPSWGEMLRAGKDYLYEAPTYAVLPGVVLTLTILAFDTIGRALNRVLEDQRGGDTIDGGRA